MTCGYDVLTAWVLASWIPENWQAVPYLFFFGPSGSGKTWALEVLKAICFRPFLAANMTMASLFRIIERCKLTLFLDETEAYLMEDKRGMLNLLNSGYRRGSPVARTGDAKQGYPVEFFDLFGFKAFAGTKELIPALRSRCLIFNMSKTARQDVRSEIDVKQAENLKQKLLYYRLARAIPIEAFFLGRLNRIRRACPRVWVVN